MSALLDPQSEWASLIVSAFADGGVRDVIVSPGSRSTPFVLAVAREPRLRIHSIVDERAAGFFALGQARACGRPSLLLCTSGSAPAHYLPAVIEARHARLPLLVLSADRPLEAQASDAAQTIDQVKLFGDAASFFELGAVDPDEAALVGTKRLVAEAVDRARRGAAIHVNARARKPLEPHAPVDDVARAASARIAALRARPARVSHVALEAPDPAGIAQLAAWIRDEPAGVIVLGPRGRARGLEAPLVALAARAGYPILADATQDLHADDPRVLPGALSLLGSRMNPRLVILVGPAPVAAAFDAIVATSRLAIVGDAEGLDALGRAALLCRADPTLALPMLVAALHEFERSEAPSVLAWRRAHAAAAAALAAQVGETATSELATVRAVVEAAGDAQLCIGNSLAVRELELAAAIGAPVHGRVLHQRGASGIDGLVAGAVGAASVGGSTVLVLGDVSLLHDLHGLVVAARATAPLAIVVLANGGGRIFDTLPIGEHGDERVRALFTTPVEHDLAALARFAGIAYARTDDATTVGGVVRGALAHVGATLIEARVAPDSARALARALPSIVDKALGAVA